MKRRRILLIGQMPRWCRAKLLRSAPTAQSLPARTKPPVWGLETAAKSRAESPVYLFTTSVSPANTL